MKAYLSGLLIASFCLCVTRIVAADATTSSDDLVWTVSLSETDVFPGQPVLANINVSNAGKSPARVDFGWDGIGTTRMAALDENGTTVCQHGRFGLREGGLHSRPRKTLQPGEQTTHTVIVNRWCSTNLPEGDYTVAVMCETLPGSGKEVRADVKLHIRKYDENEAKEYFAAMADRAFGTHGRSAFLACEEFSFTDSPAAYEYQCRMLKTRYGQAMGKDMIEFLQRNSSPENTKKLIDMAEGSNPDPFFRNRATRAVFQIDRETRNPDSARLAKEFTREREEPQEISIGG
ncbi:hypothetical protein JW916_10285 [Candidatus Sumerlaeota bacterium]|nr:hypothetical protein [Candidatus Sumerlaeota bacterium]